MSEHGASTSAGPPGEVDADEAGDLPWEAWENAVEIPLSDPPEHIVTIRVESTLYSRSALYSMLKLVGDAAVPTSVHFVFGTTTPPPLLVRVEEAAECLAIPVKHLRKLILEGWLTPVHHRDHERLGGPGLERALETDQWPGWELRVIWTELVELAQWCKDNRHIPTAEDPPPKMRRWAGQQTDHLRQGDMPNRAALVRGVLRSAVDEDGSYVGLSLRQIHQELQKVDPDIAYKTVQSGIYWCRKNGYVRRREYKRVDDPRYVLPGNEDRKKVPDSRFGSRGRAVLYRWVEGADAGPEESA